MNVGQENMHNAQELVTAPLLLSSVSHNPFNLYGFGLNLPLHRTALGLKVDRAVLMAELTKTPWP